ncbi:MAG: T9SS type A sorting domain-containing protein [Bacteroidales bacterium]
MRTLKITISIATTFLLLFLFTSSIFAQLEFVGNYQDGMGGAGWDADGSGPEPYGNGHGDIFYYTASRDYLDGEDHCGGELTDVLNGFPTFEQELAANGYSYDQVTLKFALANLGDDVEGIDYFTVDGLHYCNFYPIVITFELDGEPLIEAVGNYGIYITGTNVREFESGFLKINNISNGNNEIVADAFMADIATEELQLKMTISPDNAATFVNVNGRTGAYIDVTCTFEKGLPEIPMQGLISENMGTAAWNADGTGPEPYGNGHGNVVYYSASVDYDGINPDPNACLAKFLDGSQGFKNTLLQLQYRGFEISDLKVKMGLCSLGPDVENEDWGFENGYEWLNEYNIAFTVELNNEPILEFLQDTNKMTFINPATVTWATESSICKVYDISGNASTDAQFVVQSFLKDLGSHRLKTDVSNISLVGQMPSGDGRTGVWYDLVAGSFVGVHEQATFVSEGTVSGTWTAENSPYYIEGPITVENNQMLTIEPGVRVAVRGTYPITVKGNIMAEGTADNKIMFTASNPNITFDGLDYEGGNIVSAGPSVFDHCIFQYGKAMGGGEYNSGGIFAVRDYDDIEIYNSVFRHNLADLPDINYYGSGGAIALWNASPFIQKCIFYDNYALEYAGAILVYMESEPIISNCLFYNNESERGGAIAFYENSNGILINSTIADNVATLFGGALYFYQESNPEIINSILWNNEAASSGNEVYFSNWASTPGFYYNDIEGGLEGFGGLPFTGDYENCIDEDPYFGEVEEFHYKISEGSLCVNVGVPSTSSYYYLEYQPEYCLCGFERNYGGCIDMGAYETDIVSRIGSNHENSKEVVVYPNPAASTLYITGNMINEFDMEVEILNLLGQTTAKYKISEMNNTIELSELKSGTYFLKLTAGTEVITQKFVKK